MPKLDRDGGGMHDEAILALLHEARLKGEDA